MTQHLSPEQLRSIFEQTLSANADARRNAESILLNTSRTNGYPLLLLRLIQLGDLSDEAIRQAAAIHFKNIVKKGWDTEREEGNDGILISDQDRTVIKENLVQLMCEVPPSIQAQCAEAISLIAALDFPSKWDSLLPTLVCRFGSDDPRIVNGVLITANSLFKSFRYVQRSDKLYEHILYSLKHVQEPLLLLFKTTDHAVGISSADAKQLKPHLESLRLICRIFFSLNYQDLPEFFEDTMGEWMSIFAKYLEYNNALMTDDDEELEASPIDRLQSAIVENLNLYADKDEETFLPFLPSFTRLVWNLLMRLTIFPKHDILSTKCIRFLASLVKKQMHQDLFKDESTLRQIIGNIVIPNLRIREVDQERFEDDPAEYIATDIEGSETESRRKCSQELLRAMCRQYEKQTTSICHEHVASMLIEYKNNPSKNWPAKDAAICLMFGISILAESSTHGVSQVNEPGKLMDFFTAHIIPELQDNNHSATPMLKSTSLKFVSTFRNQFSKQQLIALMHIIVLHLASPVVVVHTYAAFTIERILTTKDGNVPRFGSVELRPFLEMVFNSLFDIIGNISNNENEHVMKCVMRILMVANEDVVPATQVVLSKLTDSLTRVAKNPRNPRYNHWLFESIAVLIRSVCKAEPKATTAFEALLFPPFQIILQMDVSEFTPYVFQIFAQLLEYSIQGSALSDSYKGMFQGCLSPVAWERKGNIPALTRLLRAYVQKSAVEIVTMGSFMALLGVWQKLVSSKANEQSSFELLSAIVRHVPQESLKPVMKQIFAILCTRLQSGKTARFVRLMTNFLALFVGIFGAEAFFEQLNTLQANMSLMILMQVWLPRMKADPPSRIDAKTHVIALTKLLCETQVLLRDQNTRQAWGEIVALTVFLLSSPTMVTSPTDDDPVETEISSDAGFSVLNNARKPIEDPFSEIANPMVYFAQSLSFFSSSHPGQLQPFIQQSLAGDPKLASGLESMLQGAGVKLT